MPTPVALFPTSLPSFASLFLGTNRAVSQLNTAIDASTTSIPIQDTSRFQTPCLVVIDNEIIAIFNKTSSILGGTLNDCHRGFGGSLAASHAFNSYVKGYIIDYHHNQLVAEIIAVCQQLGVNLANVVQPGNHPAVGDISGSFTAGFSLAGLTPSPVGVYGSADQSPVITIDDKGRVTSIAEVPNAGTGHRVLPVFFKAAIAQGSNAVLGFSFPDAGSAPSAVPINGTNQFFGVAEFTNGNDYWIQDHFPLPTDWTGQIDLEIVWMARTGTASDGNVVWQCQVAGMDEGTNSDITWATPAASTTVAPGAHAGYVRKTLVANIIPGGSGISEGNEFFFRFMRNGTSANDTFQHPADLISLKFLVRRQWALDTTTQ